MYSISSLSKKFNLEKSFLIVVGLFLFWRVSLVLFSILAVKFIPIYDKTAFLGGGYNIYSLLPEFYGLANFDGEHYLSISIFGYKSLQQAFFPIYPLLVHFFSQFLYLDYFSSFFYSAFVGLIISNLSFLISLILLFELVSKNYSRNLATLTILVLLFFPTSFYFGAVYSESIFLLLSIVSFYFVENRKWVFAGVLGSVAAATRVFGILLFICFIVEAWQKKIDFKNYVWIFLIPIGLLSYMYYQFITVGDPLAFYHLQKIVGEQHQSGVTLLPQVYFRYLRIILSFLVFTPIYQTIILEFIIGIIFFILPIYGYFKKLPISYLLYGFFGFLLPTLQGSFSSLPRYVLILFPSFIILAIFINKFSFKIKLLYLGCSYILLAIEAMLFLRGYWIA